MPVKLPNGLLIYNATAHDLAFQCKDEIVIVEQDGIINAKIEGSVLESHLNYDLLVNRYLPLPSGLAAIDTIRHNFPNALIVGSQIAAQAYPGEIVYPLPIARGKRGDNKPDKSDRLVRSDKFIVFRKVYQDGSKS